MSNGYRTLSQHLNDLKKENFSLKLRIYFLEERIQQKYEESPEDVYRSVSCSNFLLFICVNKYCGLFVYEYGCGTLENKYIMCVFVVVVSMGYIHVLEFDDGGQGPMLLYVTWKENPKSTYVKCWWSLFGCDWIYKLKVAINKHMFMYDTGHIHEEVILPLFICAEDREDVDVWAGFYFM